MISSRTSVARPVHVPIVAVDHTRLWIAVTVFVVGGYLVLQRSFAYLAGLPALNLFVGEVLLVAFLLFHPEVSVGRLFSALIRPSPLGALAWAMFLLLVYGFILAVRGYFAGYPTLLVLQEIVFNIYPLYIFLGLWLAQRDPRLLERFMLGLSWVIGIYGILFMWFLGHLTITIPGTAGVSGSSGLELFRAPLGQGVALLALLAFRPKGFRMWVPFSMNLFVLLGIQSRAAYAGLVLGLVVWAALSKRIGRMIVAVGIVAALLAGAWVLDLRVEFTQGFREYSARNVVAAVVAPFDERAAQQFSLDAPAFAGTAEWRRAWWAGIWSATHDDPMRTAFGTGYGFELSSDAVLLSTSDELRTPHNWLLFALGYGGWLGAVLFTFLLVSLGVLMWRGERITRVVFGLPFLVLSTTIATFSNFYETPFAAIPVWVISGMCIAPAVGVAAARSHDLVRPRVPAPKSFGRSRRPMRPIGRRAWGEETWATR